MAKKTDEKRKSRVAQKDGQTVGAPGYKMVLSPKKGEPATKEREIMGKKVNTPNAIYRPEPSAKGAKSSHNTGAAKQKPVKSNWKGGSAKVAKSGKGYKMKSRKAPGC